MRKEIFLELFSFVFVLLFAYAAISKLLDYETFELQIGQSPLLTSFGRLLPPVVLAVELGTCVLLVIPRWRLAGFFCSFCLMTIFTAYILAILKFSPYLPCSCGGILSKLGWGEHLVFNIVFVVLAFIAALLQTTVSSIVVARHE